MKMKTSSFTTFTLCVKYIRRHSFGWNLSKEAAPAPKVCRFKNGVKNIPPIEDIFGPVCHSNKPALPNKPIRGIGTHEIHFVAIENKLIWDGDWFLRNPDAQATIALGMQPREKHFNDLSVKWCINGCSAWHLLGCQAIEGDLSTVKYSVSSRLSANIEHFRQIKVKNEIFFQKNSKPET